MASVDDGFDFFLGLAGARAGVLLVARPGGKTEVVADRRGGPLVQAVRDLWEREPSASGELFEPPVAAWWKGQPPSGMLYLELESAPLVDVQRLAGVALGLIEFATAAAAETPRLRESLELIHAAVDPAKTLRRLLGEVEGNVSALARRLGCRRASVYAICDKYGVPLE